MDTILSLLKVSINYGFNTTPLPAGICTYVPIDFMFSSIYNPKYGNNNGSPICNSLGHKITLSPIFTNNFTSPITKLSR